MSKLKNIDLSIIVNTGDDEYIHGVALSPDIDSVIYGLANIEGKFGWGILNDKFTVNNELKKFYDLNFMIGDKDLALNLFRNQMLNDGLQLTEITEIIKNSGDAIYVKNFILLNKVYYFFLIPLLRIILIPWKIFKRIKVLSCQAN